MKVWIGFGWLKIESIMGSYKHGNEIFDSVKSGEFFGELKEYFAPCFLLVSFLLNESVN